MLGAAEAPHTVIFPTQVSIVPGLTAPVIDASPATWVTAGTRYWLNPNPGGTTKYQGTLDNPFATSLWTRAIGTLFTNWDSLHRWWIVSVYQDAASGGLLGFVHEETPIGGTSDSGTGRIGLAWSTDNGETWKYLGDIIKPFGDPGGGYNINGVPFLVSGGNFYIYFHDVCSSGDPTKNLTAVARASVTTVINAAKTGGGSVTTWNKYLSGAWTSAGLAGDCTPVNIEEGVSDGYAAFSSYSSKGYMTQAWETWGNRNTFLKLYESSDFINWTLNRTLVNAPPGSFAEGFHYSTITDVTNTTTSTGVVGQSFFVYGVQDPYQTSVSVLRWRIDLP